MWLLRTKASSIDRNSWVIESISWKCLYLFLYMKEHLDCTVLEETGLRGNRVNIESKSLEFTI